MLPRLFLCKNGETFGNFSGCDVVHKGILKEINLNDKVKVITCDKNWITSDALIQLDKVASYDGVERVVGLPDLHAGKTPVGIAVKTRDMIYPNLIGNDIGCGMALFHTGVKVRKYKQDRWATVLENVKGLESVKTDMEIQEPCPLADIGTIGGGNHFAEFQRLDKVYDEEFFSKAQIDGDEVLMLVHSGSRGYGQSILRRYSSPEGLHWGDERAERYLSEHDEALKWARINRKTVAEKLVNILGFSDEVRTVLDCCHNFVENADGGFIHRKGAVSAEHSMIVIPGSRGTLTYMAALISDAESLFSVSHGAGRKWARSLCKSRVAGKYDRNTIRRTDMKSRVICHDTELLFQEAPEAYKNVDHVISALVEHELIKVIAAFRPLITFKA